MTLWCSQLQYIQLCISASRAIENFYNTFRNRIQTLEESYQRREARQREETEQLISKHRESVNQLEREKSDLQAAHARKISTFEANKLTEIERLNDTHRRVLDEVRSEHLAEVNHLKKMKEQEISATMTAFSHTKSLQGLMEQVLNSTKQVHAAISFQRNSSTSLNIAPRRGYRVGNGKCACVLTLKPRFCAILFEIPLPWRNGTSIYDNSYCFLI